MALKKRVHLDYTLKSEPLCKSERRWQVPSHQRQGILSKTHMFTRKMLFMDTVRSRSVVSEQPEEMVTKRSVWYHDRAVWLGGLGVLCFSLTLPATHLAEPGFGNVVVGLGRALVAAVLAGTVLLAQLRSGVLAVLLFAVVQGGGHLPAGDGWMLAAVGTGAVGYTEDGRLARELGG